MKKLYEYNGKLSNFSEGWEFNASESNEEMTFNPAEGYYLDKGGKFIGPQISGIEEFQYYNLKFEAECPEDCHWALFYYDAKGNTIVADTYSSIYAEQKNYSVVVCARENTVSMQIVFQSLKGVQVSNLSLMKISEKDVLKWNDDLYKTLSPLDYTAPENRMKLLPKTLDAFRSGKPWRVVMLGDSIVNDTFNSNFQALMKRYYPESDIKWLCSIRGSTGCWFYQEQENFQKYVVDLKPDLLFIGGVSQECMIEPIRKVIEMAKEQLDCEIVLSSPPLGKINKLSDLREFSPIQKELAREMNIEFIDMRKPWDEYISASSEALPYYCRDIVHGNDRGKQIAGRILTEYLFV